MSKPADVVRFHAPLPISDWEWTLTAESLRTIFSLRGAERIYQMGEVHVDALSAIDLDFLSDRDRFTVSDHLRRLDSYASTFATSIDPRRERYIEREC